MAPPPDASLRGTVYATTTMHRRGADPRDLSLVDLDNGRRVMTRVDGGGTIGQRVALVERDGLLVAVPA